MGWQIPNTIRLEREQSKRTKLDSTHRMNSLRRVLRHEMQQAFLRQRPSSLRDLARNVRSRGLATTPQLDEETAYIVEKVKKVITNPSQVKEEIKEQLEFVGPIENYLEDKKPPELHRWGGDAERKAFNAATGNADHSLEDGTCQVLTEDGPEALQKQNEE